MSKMNATSGDEDRLIRGPEDVPTGLSDEEQLEFWETHEITEEFLARTEEVPAKERPRPRPRDRHGTLRLDRETVEGLSALADAKGVPFQALARDLLREGIRRVELDLKNGRPEETGDPEAESASSAGRDAFAVGGAHAGRSERSGLSVSPSIPSRSSSGLRPWDAPAKGMRVPSAFVGMASPSHGFGYGFANELMRGSRPGILLGPAHGRDAVRTTQQIVQQAMLKSQADALNFGSRGMLRRLGGDGMVGLQTRLAQEAIRATLSAAGFRRQKSSAP